MEDLKTIIVTAIITLDVDVPTNATEQYIESIREEALDNLSRALTHTDFIIEEILLEEV